MRFITLFVAVFSMMFAGASGATNFSSVEYDALHDLFVLCGGLDWVWTPTLGSPWVFTSPSVNPCNNNWQGIICNAEATSATQLDLNSMNLFGNIPDSIGNFTNLKYLYLHNNNLVGTIPTSIGELSALLQLDMSGNRLAGHIPASLSGLLNIHILYLYDNALSGTIPAWIGNLFNLRQLDIAETKMVGRIPESLGGLTHLNLLYLFENKLSGTIPSSLGLLTQLQSLGLNGNHLTGTIPESLMHLSALLHLNLGFNHINGTIPPSISNLTNLQNLYLSGTHISGTLPVSFGQLTRLIDVIIQGCRLSGTLPTTLGNLWELEELQLGQNFLSGTIPSSMSNLTKLTLLSIPTNILTGTAPNISAMESLLYYWLFENALTGSIPSEPGTLPLSLVSFELFTNTMTGSFPEQVGNLSQLFEFNNFGNYFSGTLPASLGQLSSSLQYIEVYNNYLTGSIPSSFAALTMLTTLLLENNHLSGDLSDVFNSTTQTRLFTIQVGGNVLQGTLPSGIFALPLLDSFSAVGNCFEGSLPENICGATSLSMLLLDGASSGCHKRVLLNQAHTMQGTVPPCLLQMPHLQVLHLSSNGFTGSLPTDMAVGPALYDLALDHNCLTGNIPVALQNRTWRNLDVSFNKLTGTIERTFASQGVNSSVSLNNNRLSGTLPSSLLDMEQVDVLAGNLFACKITGAGRDLPQHDGERRHYQCGSNAFDVPYYFWLALVVACLLVAVTIMYYSVHCTGSTDLAVQMLFSQLHTWHTVWRQTTSSEYQLVPRVKAVFEIHAEVTKAAVAAGGYIVCVLLPVYLALGAYYATHTHEYAYTVSAAFLTGTTAGAIEFVFFTLLAWLLFVGFHFGFRKKSSTDSISTSYASTGIGEKHTHSRSVERAVVWSIFISLNLVVVLGANIGFLVASTNANIHSNVLTFLQVMLAVFKLTWRWVCGHLIRWASHYSSTRSGIASTDPVKENTVPAAEFATLQVFIALVNNIAIPCVVAAVASPNCFYNYFYKAADIEVIIDFPFCTGFSDSVCTTYTPATTDVTYQPPFTYGYQCSSSLLTYYAPSFLISCLLVTFVFPVTQVLLLCLFDRAVEGSCLRKLLSSYVPRIMRSLDAAGVKSLQSDPSKPHFDAHQFMIAQLSQVGILLTFGVVFPPLGVALVVTLLSVQYYTQLLISRYVCSASEKNFLQYIDVLEAECAPAESIAPMLRNSGWMLLSFNCCFCALFVFDVLGDKVGFNGAAWVLIVLPLLPALLFGVQKAAEFVLLKGNWGNLNNNSGIEMSHVVQSPLAPEAL